MDATDRKLLALLADDAETAYRDLGERLGLSAPSVFERVKKLKAQGVIKRNTIAIDGEAIGRPLLAFVHVNTEGWGKSPELMAIQDDPRIEEIHAVAGDTCLIIKVRCESTKALEQLLKRIYDVPGVQGTRSYIALNTYLERNARTELVEPEMADA
ncbi:Lrp/AsnC family transcriptional regulator [Dongia rigui]|uniref:Lrp/AsnC family transcriptional regulator n=1 Tax=Dongia rigui TaxID=940149 RepID=A0ABU5DTR2_9PROT|nr:Lrp/AsnC family transcriptional regulator [Dongia rigui]MDY0870707.1 Lrp/AsnC family transcriptional regulator [Dongia rigui]